MLKHAYTKPYHKCHTHQDKSTRIVEIDRDDVYLYKVVTWEDVLYHGDALADPRNDYIRPYAHNNLPMTRPRDCWEVAALKMYYRDFYFKRGRFMLA